MSYSEVTSVGLQHLDGLKQLQMLDLRAAAVTNAGLRPLRWLTQLRGLNLSYTAVTDAGLNRLKKLTRLRELSLRITGVAGAGFETPKGVAATPKAGPRRHQSHRRRFAPPHESSSLQNSISAAPKSPTPVWSTSGGLTQLRDLNLQRHQGHGRRSGARQNVETTPNAGTSAQDQGHRRGSGTPRVSARTQKTFASFWVTDSGLKHLTEVCPNCENLTSAAPRSRTPV